MITVAVSGLSAAGKLHARLEPFRLRRLAGVVCNPFIPLLSRPTATRTSDLMPQESGVDPANGRKLRSSRVESSVNYGQSKAESTRSELVGECVQATRSHSETDTR